MGESEGGAGGAADFRWAGGDVLQGAPAAGEQGDPAFAEAAQRALDGVAGAGIDIGFPAVCGLLDRDVHPDARAVVAGISKGWQAGRGGPGQPGQDMAAGSGDVVHRAGLGIRYPEREAAGGEDRLDVAAVSMRLAATPVS